MVWTSLRITWNLRRFTRGWIAAKLGGIQEAGDGMRCPQCKSDNTRVVRIVYREEKGSNNRRHECLDCGARFTTIEFVVPDGFRPDPQKLIQYWLDTRRPTPASREVRGEDTD
jgi:DNA-directed RNA polymerase subunit RPC12/RpoP